MSPGELIVLIDSSHVSPNCIKFFRFQSIAQRSQREGGYDAVAACLTIYMAGMNAIVKYYRALKLRKTPVSFFWW